MAQSIEFIDKIIKLSYVVNIEDVLDAGGFDLSSSSEGANMTYQTFHQIWVDPFQDVRQKTQQNNDYSSYVQSYERVAKTNEKVSEHLAINELSNRLRSVSIRPLPETIEPEFSLPSSLPLLVRDFIDTVSQFKGVHPPMVFAALLGAVFCAARGKFWLQISGHHRELLTGYMLISAPSGSRKTAISQVLRRVFENHEKTMRRDMAEVTPSPLEHQVLDMALQKMKRVVRDDMVESFLEGESTQNLLSSVRRNAEKLAEFQQQCGLATSLPRLLMKNLTMEAIPEEIARQNGFIGLWDDEGGIWKKSVKHRDDDIFLHGYTGESFSYITKTSGAQNIESPCMAILNFVQPSILRGLYDKESLVGDGLLPRVLPLLCPSTNYTPSDILSKSTKHSIDWYEKSILSLLGISSGSGERLTIRCSPDACDLHKRFVSDAMDFMNRKGTSAGLESFVSKAPGHAARIAGALHLLQHPKSPQNTAVDASTMETAIRCTDAFLQHAAIAFTPSSRDALDNAKKIIEHVKKTACRGYISRGSSRYFHVSRDFQRDVSLKASDVSAAAQLLEDHGYLLSYHGPRGRVVYIFNPSLFQAQPLQISPLRPQGYGPGNIYSGW